MIKLVKVNKYFIPLKANLTEELEESNRTILKIQKLSSTQKLFPRKYSVIKKNPL